MLRSLDSGVFGLQAQQTMLDVTANNIANVNTAGFKASSVQFEDALSQVTRTASAPTDVIGGTTPAAVGLGVRAAGIDTDWTQGATQTTGKATNLTLNGDGFFVIRSAGQTQYTRAGNFTTDDSGTLVTPDGARVQGWGAAGGVVNSGVAPSTITIPLNVQSPAVATTSATATGNLPSDAAAGAVVSSSVRVHDAAGGERTLTLTFTSSGGGSWSVNAADANGATASGPLAFTAGARSTGGTLAVGGISVDMTQMTVYAGATSAGITKQNGSAAGALQSFTFDQDGTIEGSFSNGARLAIGRVAVATFSNPSGFQKAGSSAFTATADSGIPQVAADSGTGTITVGAYEGSNVDLGREFTNLIVSQRAFQASARVITTSDEILQELTQLKSR
ncbi:flagellar hook protein [Leifsonia xyli subsp. xyli]|uniref:Flagellar hook protein FlgE n=2 Tax=Leifsonia xyli subsp. xyli TaxID=59736 RepID=Q6AGA2_LEIXX|nr:flagellar hook protein FlgE [Leifsonia xyli]AAT88593.1 flagellar hook protein [Leifsonia xyli subsp. xyli str. CTCB07]ODA90537.1 flagellar hook protein [Leifsonia xyli subsp. xyli]